MPRFHVTYYYYATGMDKADSTDHGIVEAKSPREARLKVVAEQYPRMPERDTNFLLGCLTAKPVRK